MSENKGKNRERSNYKPFWLQVLWWEIARMLLVLLIVVFYRHRWWGAQRIPQDGPVLLVSNHQSFLDLAALGSIVWGRQFFSLARATLFDNPVFGLLIRTVNAIPVDQERGDVRALRMAIDVLRAGRTMLIFPEGSRSEDGEIHEFQEGVMLLIRRAKPTVVPVAVDGLYEAWPIGAKGPRLTGRSGSLVGEAIPAEDLIAMGTKGALNHLKNTVIELRDELRIKLGRGERDDQV